MQIGCTQIRWIGANEPGERLRLGNHFEQSARRNGPQAHPAAAQVVNLNKRRQEGRAELTTSSLTPKATVKVRNA